MNPSKKPLYYVIVSIIFAAVMQMSPTIFADTGYSQLITFLLIAVWFVPFFYVNNIINHSINNQSFK